MEGGFEELLEEELPDVGGLAPVRSLAQLRSGGGASAVRERLEPRAALEKYWGYPDFRPLQGEAVGAALAVMATLPTGSAEASETRRPAEIVLPGVYAALPMVRAVREAEPSLQPELRNRPAQRERRCAFGIFPQVAGRCIA